MHNLFQRYRFWLISIPIVISLIMLLPMRNAKINPDLMDYLPEEIEAKINIEKIEEIFGADDPVLIFFETDDVLNSQTLKRLRDINMAVTRQKEFKDVISLFESKYIRGEDGMMLVDPVVKSLPPTQYEKDILRDEIKNNPLVYKLLVSEDFRYTLMMLNPDSDISDEEIFQIISVILAEHKGDEKIYFSGLPFLRYEIQKKAIRDLLILFPLGLIIMLVFLYFSFKEMRAVLLPFSVVIMSVIIAMGMMPLLNYDFSLIAVLIPIMMIAIANNYGIHIIARYQELTALHPGWDTNRIVKEVMSLLSRPLILTALTTIIGILGLAVHIMVPARQMGIVSAAGIGFALILSLFYIPAVMNGFKRSKTPVNFKGTKKSVLESLLSLAGRAATQRPVVVIFTFLAVLIIAGIGISKLHVSINLEKMMPSSHSLRLSTDIANKHFGGTKYVSVLFEGDILEPEVLQTMDEFETKLKALPEVGHVISLATVVRTISRALNDPGDEYFDVIPDDRNAIAQYIEFYNMSGDPEDFEKIVDFNYTKALLNIQFKAKDIKVFKRVTAFIDDLIMSSPYCKLQGGQSLVEKEMAESIVRGQIYSLVFAVVAIALLLWLIFRSMTAGLLGIIPLFFALICNFGLMGWAGFDLDIATSLLSSIAIGIGVDYIIHFFWRLKFEIGSDKEYKDAISNSLSTTGLGISINAFSVIIGFSVLFLSGLTILKTFSLLIIFSLLLCLLCSLLLVPAICMILKPKFLHDNSLKVQFFAKS